MNISLEYFLTVAEERSITRAAEKLFVSQQCVSSHIKKLEQLYQAELFTRRPVFRLTLEGEALRQNLLRQRVLESALAEELDELRQQRINRIRVGIHNTRASLILPSVIRNFHQIFPDVQIKIHQRNTSTFETMLLNGDLDLFLATDTRERPEFRCTFLQREQIILMATRRFLREHAMDSVLTAQRVSPAQLARLPFICSPEESYLQTKIDAWSSERRIALQKKIVVGTYQIQLILAAQSEGAAFCPQMFLQMASKLNQSVSDEDQLVPITVEDFHLSTELSVITHRDAYQSAILRKFSDILTNTISSILNINSLSML